MPFGSDEQPALVLAEMLAPQRDYVNGRIITVTTALRDDPRVERIDLGDAAERLGT